LPRKTDSNNPGDWLLIAESDLEGVRTLAEREIGYSMCRSKLAEILEKLVKAELIRMGWFLEKTHDLEKLANELAALNSDLIATVKPLCIALAEVYFSDRYPGFDIEEPNWPDFRLKLAAVEQLACAVRARVGPVPVA
jgi:HEPN domain-containing protein